MQVTNGLSFCNMDALEARKVTNEKVQLGATRRDRNL